MARSNQMPEGNSGVIIHDGFSATHFGGEGGYWRTLVRPTTAVMPAIAGGAALGVGRRALTLPAGDIMTVASKIDLSVTQTQGNVTANTPTIGLGTTVASGAVAVLSGTAAFQNIVAGTAAANSNGAVASALVGTQLLIPAANSHDVFVNVAGTWSASGDTGLLIRGSFVIHWIKVT